MLARKYHLVNFQRYEGKLLKVFITYWIIPRYILYILLSGSLTSVVKWLGLPNVPGDKMDESPIKLGNESYHKIAKCLGIYIHFVHWRFFGCISNLAYKGWAMGIRSFQKIVPFFAFFSVLLKRTKHSLRSFPFFLKERNDLCVLFRSF